MWEYAGTFLRESVCLPFWVAATGFFMLMETEQTFHGLGDLL